MFLVIRLIPVVLSLIVGINFSLMYWFPNFYIYFLVINAVLTILGTLTLIHRSYHEHKKNKHITFILFYILNPLLFITSTSLFVLFLNNFILYFAIVLISMLFLFMYLESNFLYLYYPAKYKLHSRENIAEYMGVSTLFFMLSSFMGLIIFLKAPIWILSILTALVVGALFMYTLWINKIEHYSQYIILGISTLIITELFYVLNVLPLSFYVNALLITLVYYLISTYNLLYFHDELETKKVRKVGLIILSIIIIILLTARWT